MNNSKTPYIKNALVIIISLLMIGISVRMQIIPPALTGIGFLVVTFLKK